MSYPSNLHLILSIVMFVIVIFESRSEPIWLRLFTAAIVALFWLPLLIMFVMLVVADLVSGKRRRRRK